MFLFHHIVLRESKGKATHYEAMEECVIYKSYHATDRSLGTQGMLHVNIYIEYTNNGANQKPWKIDVANVMLKPVLSKVLCEKYT